jgi:hypothetical protein
MSSIDALALASVGCDFHVAEAVDLTQVVVGKIPKRLFRSVSRKFARSRTARQLEVLALRLGLPRWHVPARLPIPAVSKNIKVIVPMIGVPTAKATPSASYWPFLTHWFCLCEALRHTLDSGYFRQLLRRGLREAVTVRSSQPAESARRVRIASR